MIKNGILCVNVFEKLNVSYDLIAKNSEKCIVFHHFDVEISIDYDENLMYNENVCYNEVYNK